MPVLQLDGANSKPVKEKGVDLRDAWPCRGDKGIWRREHRKSRTALFTPLRVAQGPARDTQLLKIRVTRGVRVDNGQTFSVSDDWTQSSNAHSMLPFVWIGSTIFKCASDFIAEYNDNADEYAKGTLDSPNMGTLVDPIVGTVSSLGYNHMTSAAARTTTQ